MCVVLTLVVMELLNIIQNKGSKLVINGFNILQALEKDKIGVYIDGEVNNPGLVQIQKGKDLEYALNKLGGVTKEADIDSINIKQVLKNGEKIFIPSKRIKVDEVGQDKVENAQSKSGKININTSSIEELKTLEGVGDKIAQKIVEYRESNRFGNIEQIMEVKGIGEDKYKKIKSYICV